MRNAVHDHDFGEIEWADAIDARDVDTELAWIRATLVVGMDPTGLAEVVLRRSGVELIESQVIPAFDKFDIRKLCGNRNGAPHPAIRT